MKYNMRLVNALLRWVFKIVIRIDPDEIQRIPIHGPFILVGNHINFLEAPILIPHLDNPEFTALAKKETWDNPLFNFLFTRWQIIPIDRDAVDREAFRLSAEALDQGKILAVSPEGTRSGDGCLLPAKPGVVILAMRNQVPIIPIGFYGHEHFWENLKHLRRTEFHVVVGKPFYLDQNGGIRSREERQAAADEIMYKIAELLPERYHGHYALHSPIDYHYIVPA